MISRAHKIRLYPTDRQATLLRKTAGVARYAYNHALDVCESKYKSGEKHPSGYDLRKMWVAEHPEWADEVAASCIYKSFLNVDAAYKAFFQKRVKHPKHHKKGVHDSFYVAADKGRIIGKKVRVPGIGYIKLAEELRYDDADIKSYVVSQKAGKWYVSVQCEIAEEFRTESSDVVGVDVGIKHWAVSSDGTVLDDPKQLKHYERILKRKQRLLARKQKGSHRRAKARLAVAATYQKISNIKLDAIHKFTETISKSHGIVVVEDLNVSAMSRSGLKSIRKGVHNSAMAEIHRQLKYKCNNHVVVDRFYPSSKTCSNCGNVKKDLTLYDRVYHCGFCRITIDRDLNAALNLRKKGLEIIYGGSHRE